MSAWIHWHAAQRTLGPSTFNFSYPSSGQRAHLGSGGINARHVAVFFVFRTEFGFGGEPFGVAVFGYMFA